MRIDFTDMLYSLSFALDAVEHELTGVTAEHGKRVAWLCCKMTGGLGFTREQLVDFVGCAILHDNALAEYLREEADYARLSQEAKPVRRRSNHMVLGEDNVRLLPFRTDVTNVILYHHENADGTGPLKKTAADTDIRTEILHLADYVDLKYRLQTMTEREFWDMSAWVTAKSGRLFTDRAATQFFRNVSWEDIADIQSRDVVEALRASVPDVCHDYTDEEVEGIALFFSRIVDYKSSFTKRHSLGVAEKARAMAEHYGWPHDKVMRYYFAGAMHDIGKLIVGNDILEKPDKLTAAEFAHMKDHAAATLRLLSSINGFDDIVEWAANHHEKLDGTGYARGLSAADLPFEDRLMACIDIYQALTEPRPYKDGMDHCKAMKIMYSMASDGKIDADITSELDRVFGGDQCGLAASATDGAARRFRCRVCGYIHEGDEPPALCPICDSERDAFEAIG